MTGNNNKISNINISIGEQMNNNFNNQNWKLAFEVTLEDIEITLRNIKREKKPIIDIADSNLSKEAERLFSILNLTEMSQIASITGDIFSHTDIFYESFQRYIENFYIKENQTKILKEKKKLTRIFRKGTPSIKRKRL